jgi:regulator of sigma E protease
MSILISIVSFLILIGLVVTIHEAGHFIVGRLCGMKMLEFSIGFGRKIYQREFGKDKTLFTLRLLPLGGFVKPLDQRTMKEEEWNALSSEEQARSYNQSSHFKKILMVAGGPFANFVLAFVLFVICFAFIGTQGVAPVISEIVPHSAPDKAGMKTGEIIQKINNRPIHIADAAASILFSSMLKAQVVSLQTDKNTYTVDYSHIDYSQIENNSDILMGIYLTGLQGDLSITEINADSAASQAGLKTGDIVKTFNGISVHDINKTVRMIQNNAEKQCDMTVLRQGKIIDIKITPHTIEEKGEKFGRIGVTFKVINTPAIKTYRYGFKDAVVTSLQKIGDLTSSTLVSIGKLITGELSSKSLSGPVAIAQYSGQSAQLGLYEYLTLVASISIAIGIFNLLPIPALDGGHLLQYVIEIIIVREIPPSVLYRFQMIGFMLLTGVFMLSLFNDVSKLFH